MAATTALLPEPPRLPVAERAAGEVLCLPMFPELESDEVGARGGRRGRLLRRLKSRMADLARGLYRWRFLAVVLLPGAVLMALEIVSSRLLAPAFGNSVYVWGSIIGVFLAAMSAGYVWGGRRADASCPSCPRSAGCSPPRPRVSG